MIEKIHVCNKMNLSSNINKVIRAVLVFFTKRFRRHQKAQKAQKSTEKCQNHQKRKNAMEQKHKTQISEQKLKMRLKNI